MTSPSLPSRTSHTSRIMSWIVRVVGGLTSPVEIFLGRV